MGRSARGFRSSSNSRTLVDRVDYNDWDDGGQDGYELELAHECARELLGDAFRDSLAVRDLEQAVADLVDEGEWALRVVGDEDGAPEVTVEFEKTRSRVFRQLLWRQTLAGRRVRNRAWPTRQVERTRGTRRRRPRRTTRAARSRSPGDRPRSRDDDPDPLAAAGAWPR
jgi:hypothetical protein